VKNDNSVIVTRIIHNFKRIPGAVKTNNDVFFGKFVNRGGVYFGFENVQYVLSADTVPECRFVELNYNVNREKIA
jgi:hypothetical protein